MWTRQAYRMGTCVHNLWEPLRRFALLLGHTSLSHDQAILHDLTLGTQAHLAMASIVAQVDAALSTAYG